MKYQKTFLKNGIQLIVIPMPENPTTTVSVIANVGARYEDKANNGISHFLEHLLFKGTEKRTARDLTVELDTLAAEYNAFTSYELTACWARVNKKYFSKVADILSDIYINACVPAEEMEKERGVILEEINMYDDDNRSRVSMILRELLYPKQPLGAPVLGPKENIKKMSRQDVLDYKQRFYTTGSTTVIVAGDVKLPEVKKELENRFAQLPTGKKQKPVKVVEKQKASVLEIFEKKSDQTHLAMAFRTVPIDHKDVQAIAMLRGVLSSGMSSRLFTRMRDELGICYYCYASADYSFDSGSLSVFAGVGNDRTEEAVREILAVLKDVKENGVSKKELDKVKKNAIGRIAMNLETSEDYSSYYSLQATMCKKIVTPAEQVKIIKSITPEQVQQVAQRFLTDKTLNLAVVGPHKKNTTKIKKLLKI